MKKFFNKIIYLIIFVSLNIYISTSIIASIDHIVINEVEYDTPWHESKWEWFELFNPTLNDINLKNWWITEKTTSWYKTFTLPNVIIHSWDYITIWNDTAEFNNIYPNDILDIDMSWNHYFRLKNTPYDELTLRDEDWNVIDYVSWENTAWWWDIEAVNAPICRISRDDTDTVVDWTNNCTSTPWYSNIPNFVPTDIVLNNNSINENNLLLDTIWDLSNDDLDTYNTHTYSLVSWEWDNDNSSFLIDWNILKINVVSDYEIKSSYNIRIRVNDNAWWLFEKKFIININNLDEEPPVILIDWNDAIFELWNVSNSDIDDAIQYTCTDNFDSECNVVISWANIDINSVWTYIVKFNAVDSSWNHATEVTKKIIIKKPEIILWEWWNWWQDPDIIPEDEVVYLKDLKSKEKELENKEKEKNKNNKQEYIREQEKILKLIWNKKIINKYSNYIWFYNFWFIKKWYFSELFKSR